MAFSEVFDAARARVEELARSRPLPAGWGGEAVRAGGGDPGIARYLWAGGFGTGGADDVTLAAGGAAARRALARDEVLAIAPLYVSSICAEQCLYCNFRGGNRGVGVERRRLTDEEVEAEARFLAEAKGLRVIELVYATDPRMTPDAICRHAERVRRALAPHGGGLVGLSAPSFTTGEYRQLKDSGVAFAVQWQETYDEDRYRILHPGRTKKADFRWRLDAYERMAEAGLDAFGVGILSGLADWRKDWAMLLEHEAHLARTTGRPPAILGIPRLKPAPGAVFQHSATAPGDGEFASVLAIHARFAPATRPFVSTREAWDLCVRLAAGGGCLFTFNCSTTPGGYSLGRGGEQFPANSYDVGTYAGRLAEAGLNPRFAWELA